MTSYFNELGKNIKNSLSLNIKCKKGLLWMQN